LLLNYSSHSTESSPAILSKESSQLTNNKDASDSSQGLPTPKDSTAYLHAHIHNEDSLRKIVNRLSRLEGQIRGVKTMVQDNRPCPEVLIQIAAVKGGLDRLARVILDDHINECITRAVDDGNIEAELSALKSVLDRFIV